VSQAVSQAALQAVFAHSRAAEPPVRRPGA
jgi:hypothetical protein